MIPYFYILQNTITGNYYAGAKWSKDADPALLLIKYKTSSKVVSSSIKNYVIKKIKIFQTPSQAINYEKRFLIKVDAARNKKFDNMNYGNTPQQFNKKWYNNGVKSTLAYECPPGFAKGRILNTSNLGKHGNQRSNLGTWKKGQSAWNKGISNPRASSLGKANAGKTWKLVNGKRTWMEKNDGKR
jgi:hypothetical protein